jgi:hypothetical protein
MQWTKERTTFLGTSYEKHAKWHGIPYVVRFNSTKGMSTAGWWIVILAVLLLIIVALIEEFVF